MSDYEEEETESQTWRASSWRLNVDIEQKIGIDAPNNKRSTLYAFPKGNGQSLVEAELEFPILQGLLMLVSFSAPHIPPCQRSSSLL